MIIDRAGVDVIASLSGSECRIRGCTPDPRLSRPVGHESLFLCLCKEKVTKKKAHPVLAPSAPAVLRVRKSGRNFCKGHPCPLQKRRASVRAALRVVSAGLAAAVWGPESQQLPLQSQRCWYAVGRLFGALRGSAVAKRSRPFRPRQRLSRPVGRESLFFACAKKSNQKKAHPVLAPSAPMALWVRKSGRNFCKGHPCPLQKRRASMRAALRVVSAGLAAAVWGPESQQPQPTQRWCLGGCLFGALRGSAVGRRRYRSVTRRGHRQAQGAARRMRRGLSC
ncbi:hypothetical protein XFF6166_240030 [Xanthomonas citri pv. fuscans]|nr:hypothetical protein XFF6166_240030 [Xanthomonas citri pv. fuscans]SOO01932.1 hypothetical protein XFF6960_540030 [Xanthomonas citri pv. fuscans]SOO04594.1 hypothetical protein XFF7767_260028 [Xanthomonas citri pv. fuscans]SOO13767.1 hypothetical protein XFF7766_230054 [Xanthomonas citri pv. fuscans]